MDIGGQTGLPRLFSLFSTMTMHAYGLSLPCVTNGTPTISPIPAFPHTHFLIGLDSLLQGLQADFLEWPDHMVQKQPEKLASIPVSLRNHSLATTD